MWAYHVAQSADMICHTPSCGENDIVFDDAGFSCFEEWKRGHVINVYFLSGGV